MVLIKNIISILNYNEKIRCIVLIFAMFFGAILEAVGIGLVFPLLNILEDVRFLENHIFLKSCLLKIGIKTHSECILFLIILFASLCVFKNIYMYWLIKQQVGLTLSIQVNFAKKLITLYLRKPYIYYLNKNTAELIRNIQSSLPSIFSVMFFQIIFVITEVMIIFAIWLMLAYIDLFISTVIMGVFFVLIYLFLHFTRKKILQHGGIQNDKIADFTKWINQGLGSIKETKVMGTEEYFITKFFKAYVEYGHATKYYQVVSQMPRFIIEGIVTLGLLTVIAYKMILGEPSAQIVGVLGVLELAAFRLMPSANRIISLATSIKYIIPTFFSLEEDLKESIERKESIEKIVSYKYSVFNKSIDITNISFKYPSTQKYVLFNLSFSICKGDFVGVIGSSGVGKTTFIDILLGLLVPTSGKIEVDGKNIYDDIRVWQSNIAYVPQNIYLIDASIRENIALGVDEKDIDDEKIQKVLVASELSSFIEDLPEGVYSGVGERGVKLSGGQRQRIGIARALYQEPEILILDEATSALDNLTEKNIIDTILKLKGQITIIAVAHRLTTLEQCDFKVRLQNGKAEIIN